MIINLEKELLETDIESPEIKFRHLNKNIGGVYNIDDPQITLNDLLYQFIFGHTPAQVLLHEYGHHYVANRIKKLNPQFEEKRSNMRKNLTILENLANIKNMESNNLDLLIKYNNALKEYIELFKQYVSMQEGIVTHITDAIYRKNGIKLYNTVLGTIYHKIDNYIVEKVENRGNHKRLMIPLYPYLVFKPILDENIKKGIDRIIINPPTVHEMEEVMNDPLAYKRRIDDGITPKSPS